MPILLIPALLLSAAWAVAEFRGKPAVRRAVGLAVALMLVGSVVYQQVAERFSANHYFSSAAKDLLDASVEELRHGWHDEVLRQWEKARARFVVTYENRGGFVEVVNEAVDGMRTK